MPISPPDPAPRGARTSSLDAMAPPSALVVGAVGAGTARTVCMAPFPSDTRSGLKSRPAQSCAIAGFAIHGAPEMGLRWPRTGGKSRTGNGRTAVPASRAPSGCGGAGRGGRTCPIGFRRPWHAGDGFVTERSSPSMRASHRRRTGGSASALPLAERVRSGWRWNAATVCLWECTSARPSRRK